MRTIGYLLILSAIIIAAQSCSYEKAEISVSSISDDELFSLAEQTDFHYYINPDTIIPGAGNSPHGYFKVKFNDIALEALDSTGKLPAGTTFPKGAVIVKELVNNTTAAITHYAVMKKSSTDFNSNAGWIWGEYLKSDKTGYSVINKGTVCIGCHNNNPNRDLVRLFDLH